MNAVLQAREPSARYLAAVQPALVRQFELLATAPGGVGRLRELILTLAVQGRLVPQDRSDEPAIVFVEPIRSRQAGGSSGGRVRNQTPGLVSTEEDVPFDLPIGWQRARLGSIFTLQYGAALPEKTRLAGSIPVYGSNGQVGTHCEALVQEPSLVIGRKGSVGAVNVTSGPFWPIDTSYFVTPPDGVHLQFAYWLFRSLRLGKHDKATAIPGISRNDVYAELIALPPTAEQARIVARVDELMRQCDALEAKGRLEAEQHARLLGTLLGTLTDSSTPEELAANWQRVADHFDLLLDRPEAVDALEQTILQLAVRGLLVPQNASDVTAQELSIKIQRLRRSKRKITPPDSDAIAEAGTELPSGWSWCSVDQVSADDETAITDGPFGANLKTESYIETEGFRVIRLQNIGEGIFRNEHRAYIDEERFNRLRKHAVIPGDIVVAGLVDESIRCCIVPESVGPSIVKADCYRFAVHESVSTEYICLYLCSETAHQFASAHHHGLTLTRIGLGNFRSVPVPLPPAHEQRRIVARVTELRRLCADLRQRLTARQSTQSHLAEALVESAAA